MAYLAIAAGLKTESRDNRLEPSTPGSRNNHGPSIAELNAVELADYGNLIHKDERATSRIVEVPASSKAQGSRSDSSAWDTSDQLELNPRSDHRQNRAVPAKPSFWYPAMNRWRVLTACLIYFGNGMSDSAPGALIPYIERWYSIGYAVVSLIWIANAVGFIVAAFFTNWIWQRLGRAKTLMLAEVFMTVAYVTIACSPPFAVVVVAYLCMGFGNAMNLALNNVFCANLAESTVLLGSAHGSYGIGGTIAPIIATKMVSSGLRWERFYLILVGIRFLCFFCAAASFWNYEREDVAQFANSLKQPMDQPTIDVTDKRHMLWAALKNKTTILGAIFIFSYQGAEVSESGWFISYLINYRHGDPAKVGYVTAGFWAGITLGRFTLTHLAHRVGEKRFVVALSIGAMAFQLMAWFIPNVIGDSVSVAVLGLLLGPVYPCAQTIFTKLLPSNVQMTAISLISSMGSSGGAVVPFLVGLLAQGAGTFVLHPICLGFFVLMLGCWIALPRVEKLAAD